jgi:hypothetical protein
MAIDGRALKLRAQQARTQRELHQQVWVDCFDMTYPADASGLQNDLISANDAQSKKARIYDSTAPESVRVGVATMQGTIMPASALWFFLDVAGLTESERAFMDEAGRFVWTNIHEANFDSESFDALTDLWVAGWSVLFCGENESDGGFYFERWPIGECSIAASRTGALVDMIYRCYTLTVAQVVSSYGLDAVSDRVRSSYLANKMSDPVRMLYAIEPREISAIGAKLARNKQFRAVDMEEDTCHVLREGGFDEFPCLVPRWKRLAGSVYATGPMSDALPDVRTLNEAKRWTLMGAETSVAPMLKVVDDGVINPRNIKMGPRQIVVCASTDSIEPLNTGAKIDVGMLTVESLQASIRKILLADQMPSADGPVRTATEWSLRAQVMRQMLGPMFGRFQAEFLQPLIERCFNLAWRANMQAGFSLFGKPPASLINRSFSVRYMSPLARAQRVEEVAALDQFENSLAAKAQVFGPQTLDIYDSTEGDRERSRLLGIPQRLIRDDRALKVVRSAREQAQQQQMAAAGQVTMQDAMAKRMANAA